MLRSVGAGERFPRSGGGARLHAAERPLVPCMLMSSAGSAAPINCWKYLLTYQMGSRGAKLEGRVSQRGGGGGGTELPAPAGLSGQQVRLNYNRAGEGRRQT